MQPSIAEPAAFASQFPQAFPQIRIVRTTAAVAAQRTIRTDHRTRPSLAHLVPVHKNCDRFTPHGGRYRFRDRRSFSAAWSSMDSASNRFSRAFSYSSAFRRLASETSMPPNFAFQA